MGEIVSIVYKPEDIPEPANGYLRVPLQSARLVEGYGIEGDAKGGHPTRQLNLMAAETLDGLRGDGYSTEPGQMGEQIVLRGVDVDSLLPGDHLQLGDEAVIEVTKPRNGCERFERWQGHSRPSHMGVMAKVVVGGVIRVGDSVLQRESRSLNENSSQNPLKSVF